MSLLTAEVVDTPSMETFKDGWGPGQCELVPDVVVGNVATLLTIGGGWNYMIFGLVWKGLLSMIL